MADDRGETLLELLQAPARPALVVVPANSSGGATLAGVAVGIKTADPSVRVADLDVLGPRLRHELLHTRNATTTSYPYAVVYASTSSRVAGTDTVGPAPGIASHTPRFAR